MDSASSAPFLQLLAWTRDGRKAVDRAVGRKTLSLTSRRDGDVCVPELTGSSVFLRVTETAGTLFLHDESGRETRVEIVPGKPVEFGALTWMLVQPTAQAAVNVPSAALSANAAESGGDSLLVDILQALAHPMPQASDLRSGLQGFLQLLVNRTHAMSGMLVLAEGEGFGLVASFGLSPKDAQKLWEKMPHSLAEEVLRTKARMLLPEELRRSLGGDSTVFVRGVRSVVGFPVLAEDRLVAIFYLGFDNLLKQLSPELQRTLEAAAQVLGFVVQRARHREQLEQYRLKASASPEASLPAGRLMVGSSEKLVEVYHLLSRLAPVDVATLILGETGTGKELAAKELHRLSARGKGPFVVVNAAALPESLIESELFGHRKGAFTGALTDRIGLVEQAQGGTLFIDEIGELPQPMQAKLLRVLQERAVTRIGDAQPRPIDFRLVAATHRNLDEMVAAGTFREDLYYRIAGAVLRMPALRERPEDVITLATYFRRRFAQRHGLPDKEWSAEALFALESRPWPGNVREMENVVARAFVMAEGPVIRGGDLGFGERSPDAAALSNEAEETLEAARDAWMRAFLKRALKRHSGHRAETAKALGIGERTLFRYLEQLAVGDT